MCVCVCVGCEREYSLVCVYIVACKIVRREKKNVFYRLYVCGVWRYVEEVAAHLEDGML